MNERRAEQRFQMTPPLPGRAFIDGIGQFEAQLLDISAAGARLLLTLDSAGDFSRFLAAGEKGITGAFGRPDGVPWKFVLLHTRATTPGADGCLIAGRFISVPNFTVADLVRMVALGEAVST